MSLNHSKSTILLLPFKLYTETADVTHILVLYLTQLQKLKEPMEKQRTRWPISHQGSYFLLYLALTEGKRLDSCDKHFKPNICTGLKGSFEQGNTLNKEKMTFNWQLLDFRLHRLFVFF